MSDKQTVTYEMVSKTAVEMIANGGKPSIRGIQKLIGGRTENVSAYLKEFFDKRDSEVLKMADELGSSAIASTLASQIQLVVDKQTQAQSEIIKRLKEQLAEQIELAEEKETECKRREDIAEANSLKAIAEAEDKIKVTSEKLKEALESKELMERELIQVKEESKASVDAAEKKAELLIEAAKKEAGSLVEAANDQINKAQAEAQTLSQQVKELSIDQAKHDMEKSAFEDGKEALSQLQIDLAEQKTLVVQLQTEKQAFEKDTKRLESDVANAKETEKKLTEVQTQLVEVQKQSSQFERELNQAQREVDTLKVALSKSGKG